MGNANCGRLLKPPAKAGDKYPAWFLRFTDCDLIHDDIGSRCSFTIASRGLS